MDSIPRRYFLAVVISTFLGGVPTFLGIKAYRRRLKSVAALKRAAVQEPKHQLPGHPLSMRAARRIHKWRTGDPKSPVSTSVAGNAARQHRLVAAMALVMFLGRVDLRGKMPGQPRTRRQRPVYMANHGTRVVPRIAPLGSALLAIKAGWRCLSAVAALHLIVQAAFLGYRKERA